MSQYQPDYEGVAQDLGMEVEAVRKHHRQLREYVAEVKAARPFNAANAGQEPVAGLNEANSHAASQRQS